MSKDEDKCRQIIKEDRSGVRRMAGADEASRPKKVSSANTDKK
jgi:hypothetical protein